VTFRSGKVFRQDFGNAPAVDTVTNTWQASPLTIRSGMRYFSRYICYTT